MTIDQLIMLGLQGIRIYLPALIANAGAMIFGGGAPIDLNKQYFDGRPLFGKNKTYRGLISGLTLGTIVGAVTETAYLGLSMSFGGLMGDLVGAFIKRRLGINPGEPLPIVDQYDFVLGASVVVILLESNSSYLPTIFVLILTPLIHVLSNAFSFLAKLKNVPW